MLTLFSAESINVQSLRASKSLPLLQCQSYPGDGDVEQVHIPNIPEQNFNHEIISDLKTAEGASLVATGEDLTLIFTYPPVLRGRSCSGRILTINFCYQIPAREADELTNVFNFLLLARNDLEFRVVDRLRVRSTPTSAICTNSTSMLNASASEDTLICCDRERVENRREYLIGLSSFTFAFMNRNEARMLAFDGTETEYNLEQFQTALPGSGPPNSTFSVSEANRFYNQSIPLFKFSLGKANKFDVSHYIFSCQNQMIWLQLLTPLLRQPTKWNQIRCLMSQQTPLIQVCVCQIKKGKCEKTCPSISDTDEVISSKKNTIIVAALSGVVGILAVLAITLLLVIVLQIKNMRDLDKGNVKSSITLSSMPSNSQESLTRYEFQAVTAADEGDMINATSSVN